MTKNVRFCQSEESPKDWSWSGHSSFSSLEDAPTDYQERIMLPPKLPVRKVSCEPVGIVFDASAEEEEDLLNDMAIQKASPSILRRKRRYGKLRDNVANPSSSASNDISLGSNRMQDKKEKSPLQIPTHVPPRDINRRRCIRDMRNPSDDSLQWVRKEDTNEHTRKAETSEVREMQFYWERVPCGHTGTTHSGQVKSSYEIKPTETWYNE